MVFRYYGIPNYSIDRLKMCSLDTVISLRDMYLRKITSYDEDLDIQRINEANIRIVEYLNLLIEHKKGYLKCKI